jgi:NAD(P)-dependent dehydrogenase (short-subunit alcohol dehydrogenase family)
MQRFENKIIAITGSAKGIGKACAERFAREGARVAVLDIDQDSGACLAAEIGGLCAFCDVGDPACVQDTFQTILNKWGRLDVLVANAGVYRGAPLTELKLQDWDLVLKIDLTGVLLCCQAAAPAMMAQKSGSIVVMSSMAGKTSWPATAAYSAAKTGAIGLVRSIAQELGPYNVNCNAVCLGHADTEMMRAVDQRVCAENGWPPGAYLKQLADENPMRRLGTAEETAALVAFLASDEARYINGQAIEIDGGRIMA